MEYKTIKGSLTNEIEIKKSRFITNLKECKNEDEAIAFLEEIRKEHRTATHNCYAYITGQDMLNQRFSDDGEPQGTAGIPMLEVLKKEEITNVCAVVTRYFGGIKLGASGLIRAYTQGVAEALKLAKLVEMVKYFRIDLVFDYVYQGKIDNFIETEDYYLYNRDYLEKVNNVFLIREDRLDKFLEGLNEITSAKILIDNKGILLLAEKNKKICEEYLCQDIINGVK